MPLSDTQLVFLSTAAQREDGLLGRPGQMKRQTVRDALDKLLQAGLVMEVPVTAHQPNWRTSADDQHLGLQITRAGLEAIGVGLDEPDAADKTGTWSPGEEAAAPSAADPAPSGTKRALIIDLLQRPEGATLANLAHATGWLPHTTRAALTGLRKAGYAVNRVRDDEGSRYSIKAAGSGQGEN